MHIVNILKVNYITLQSTLTYNKLVRWCLFRTKIGLKTTPKSSETGTLAKEASRQYNQSEVFFFCL